MKTLLLMLALCGACLAADKADPQVAAKERQERSRLANDFRRVADKLTADEVKAVKAIVAKHATAKPVAAKPAPTKKK